VISGRVQVVLATIPIAILFTAAIIVLFTFDAPLADPIGTPAPPAGAVTSRALAHGFLSVYFAYSGWNAAIYVGSEIRKPGRTLPRALLVGTGSVTALYMVMCAGFLAVFSIARLATVGEAGTAAARELLGARGELAITILIAVAILGSINGTVLTGSRVAFAMARSGHCPRSAGILDRRYGTPVVALWAQAGLSIALMGSQRFEQLIEYTAAAMLVTGTLTVMAVVVLRRKLADQPRPYRTWGYPVTPLVYAGSSVVVLLALVEDLDPSVFLALVWFAGALVVHRWWFHRGERPDEDPRARAVASSSDPG
jgi:APA family basic amino acid/polyamine antiporter